MTTTDPTTPAPELTTLGDDFDELKRREVLVLDDITHERKRQNHKWGVQRHSWPEWMSILAEEVGEASQMANWAHWRSSILDPLGQLRIELVQVAAVAVQIIEHIDELQNAAAPGAELERSDDK